MSFYNQHLALINEVVDFARSGPLLVPAGAAPHVRSITDFAQAKNFCWNEFIGDGEYTWTDLREKQMSKVLGLGYKIGGFKEAEKELKTYLDSILNSVNDRLDEKHQDIFDDVTADLGNCVKSRAIQGNTPGFFETLFEAYKHGMWPCGWDGSYPDGQLIVYVC